MTRNSSIMVPGLAFDDSNGGISFTSYDTPILFPLTVQGVLPNETTQSIDSVVIGASLGGESIRNLAEPVEIRLISPRVSQVI